MKRTGIMLFTLSCLLATSLVAQTQIGGGTCSSSTLSGAYAFSLTGRQVSAAGSFSGVLQGVGTATFDGLNAVKIALTVDTAQTAATALNWSGTYSMQSNCAGVITITSGGTATLNLVLFGQGVNFLVSGNDGAYSYSGTGNNQPTACTASLLSGAYSFSGTGYNATATGAVNAASAATGLLQFDGQGNVTASITQVSNGTASTPLSLTGTYSLSSNCLGSVTFSSAKPAYVMSLSISNASTSAATDLLVTFAQSSKTLISGNAHQIDTTAGACSAATLSGPFSLTLSGRSISSAGNFAGSLQGNGTITFDGVGKVTVAGTANTNLAAGLPLAYSGTYTLAANCLGTVTLTTGSTATFAFVVWSGGKQYNMAGLDPNYVYSGSGGNGPPPLCGTATLSGEYTYETTGFTLTGTTQNGSADEAGVFQFDGQGNVTANFTITSAAAAPTPLTATGTYAVTAACLATATLNVSNGKTNTLNLVITGAYGQGFDVIEDSSTFVRSGAAHSAFLNPAQSIGNVASYAVNATPAGSVFALFGSGFAAANKTATAPSVPLPTTLLTTKVTVNGEAAPLFYVDSGQIDAQMPWDIPPGSVASVVVTNGTAASNAAAVFVPATGTPGLSVYSNNRAVVVNQSGTVNAANAGAAVGDEVVAYFTGGGPVTAAGKLVTGAADPAGLSPVTGNSTVTVGGINATVPYIGLTPGAIGLYQANFFVPQIAKGTYPVVITISGQPSNNPVMTVTN